MRGFLLLTLTLSVVLAGCAGSPDAPAALGPAPSPEEAAKLFASAAGNMPERYAVEMSAVKDATKLLNGVALLDSAAKTAYFRMSFDPSMMGGAGGMGGMMLAGVSEVSALATEQGSVLQLGDKVLLSPPGEESPWDQTTQDQEGLQAIANPEALLSELKDEHLQITSVTPTSLRGKPATEIKATYTDESGEHPITAIIFADPTRVGRLQMIAPQDEGPEGAQFSGAVITLDLFYGDDIKVEAAPELARALGLRYESDHGELTETWTFAGSQGLALGDVRAIVGDDAWTMMLSEGTKSADGLTLAFADNDADGKLSAGDTLRITRDGEGSGLPVTIEDAVSGLRVMPGAGALLAGLAGVGAALMVRRRRDV